MEKFDITPVEKHGDYYFKREDLYKPFAFSPVNGSKLRQCQLLIEKNFDTAINGVITGTSVLSPQAAIVAACAKSMNISCYVFYGGTTMWALSKKKYPAHCFELGAHVEVVSKSGFTTVLTAKVVEKATKDNLFQVRYGMDLMQNKDVFIESIAEQVANIPNELDNLVITVGSGITLIGVLVGIVRNGKRVKNLYAIGCAPNRMNKIITYADMIEYETGFVLPIQTLRYVDAFNEIKGYKYEQTMRESYYGIDFHPRYEAKTFRWLRNSQLKGNTLMWITGCDF